MKALFHKWLLLFVVLAFGLTFGLSWHLPDTRSFYLYSKTSILTEPASGNPLMPPATR